MQNVRICSVFLLIFFLSCSVVLAKSGCCSGHGGVNCAAGSQGNGKVICNDGWRGSSCLYSEMVMCGGSSGSGGSVESTPLAPPATKQPVVLPTKLPTSRPTTVPSVTLIPTAEPTTTFTPESTMTPTQASMPTDEADVLGAQSKEDEDDSGRALSNFLKAGIASVGGYWLLKRRG